MRSKFMAAAVVGKPTVPCIPFLEHRNDANATAKNVGTQPVCA
jgi:hypothetical protein